MARRSKSRSRRLARGSVAPPAGQQAIATTGPVPVMDAPWTMPAEPVGLEEARSVVRKVLSRARTRS